jgi:hypothetical protein
MRSDIPEYRGDIVEYRKASFIDENKISSSSDVAASSCLRSIGTFSRQEITPGSAATDQWTAVSDISQNRSSPARGMDFYNFVFVKNGAATSWRYKPR